MLLRSGRAGNHEKQRPNCCDPPGVVKKTSAPGCPSGKTNQNLHLCKHPGSHRKTPPPALGPDPLDTDLGGRSPDLASLERPPKSPSPMAPAHPRTLSITHHNHKMLMPGLCANKKNANQHFWGAWALSPNHTPPKGGPTVPNGGVNYEIYCGARRTEACATNASRVRLV